MKKYITILILIIVGCNQSPKSTKEKLNYPNVVGDIEYNSELDGEFERCDNFSNQYYGINRGFGFKGEMSKIKEKLKVNFKLKKDNSQTGFVTIRFVVNCKGESGMFRIHSTDLLLNKFNFKKEVINQLIKETKKLKDWKIAEYNGNTYDYYQYLTYKLIHGEIVDIAP